MRIWVSELPPRDATRRHLWPAGIAASEVRLCAGLRAGLWIRIHAASCTSSCQAATCKTFSALRRVRRTSSAARSVASAGVRVRSCARKTTLLNHILKRSDHGLRFAIIENEFGEVSVDEKVILEQTEEDVWAAQVRAPLHPAGCFLGYS